MQNRRKKQQNSKTEEIKMIARSKPLKLYCMTWCNEIRWLLANIASAKGTAYHRMIEQSQCILGHNFYNNRKIYLFIVIYGEIIAIVSLTSFIFTHFYFRLCALCVRLFYLCSFYHSTESFRLVYYMSANNDL